MSSRQNNKGNKFQPKEENGQTLWQLEFMHTCQYQEGKQVLAVCKVNQNQQVPRFNSFVYDRNGEQVGKIEEVFGPVSQFYVAFKPINNYNVYSLQTGTLLGLKSSQFIDITKFYQVKVTKPLIKQRGQNKQQRGQQQRNKFGNNRQFDNNNNKKFNNRNNEQRNNFRQQGRFSK